VVRLDRRLGGDHHRVGPLEGARRAARPRPRAALGRRPRPWKRTLGHDEGFRQAPTFEARAAIAKDAALLDRVLADYERKYPAEIGRWRDKMRQGVTDGSRVLIRYTPS